MTSFSQWIDSKSNHEWWIYAKRLSANDTGLTGGNQVGIYIHKEVIAVALPSLSIKSLPNPDCEIKARVASHGFPEQTLRGIYYNNKFHEGTRNEHRITRWNTDVKENPVQDVENTGALALFAFHVPKPDENAEFLDVWVCNGVSEEDLLESQIGEIIPGSWLIERGDKLFSGLAHRTEEAASTLTLPTIWSEQFPSGAEIIDFSLNAFKSAKVTPDDLIIERRKNEYRLFLQVEEMHVLHQVQKGFSSVDEFMLAANSVSNRRKSRSGKSLEIHLEHLFNQFGLSKFSTQCKTEGNKRPDFIFPSCMDYHNAAFPSESLDMLAVKTTCKDRWRQALNEANRIQGIHLFTLQEGVSPRQFEEMTAEQVTLVVPKPLHEKYPAKLREQLLTLSDFINLMKNRQLA